MAQRGIKKIWVDSMIASGTIYQWGLVDRASSSTVISPIDQTIDPFGLALQDAADGEEIPILRIGRAYGIDKAGSLNADDYIKGAGTSEFYKLVVGAQGTSGQCGKVVGDDATAAADLVLVDYDFINLP